MENYIKVSYFINEKKCIQQKMKPGFLYECRIPLKKVMDDIVLIVIIPGLNHLFKNF